MRITLVHRYFWPDTPPYASMLRTIARALTDRADVTVCSTQPSYKSDYTIGRQPQDEQMDGFRVRRIRLPEERHGRWLKALNLLLFPVLVLVRLLLTQRQDAVMCSTTPPVLLGFCCSLVCRLRGMRFYYHCMDLHPEIGRISGEFRHPLIFRLLLAMDSWTCRSATRVIVLSTDMRAALLARPGCQSVAVSVINNFELNDFDDSTDDLTHSPQLKLDPNRFTLLFAGNVGRFQGLEFLVDAMQSLQDCADLELVILGEGKALAGLKQQVSRGNIGNIRFIPHQPVAVARRLMSEANVGVLSLQDDIYRYAYPSKTMSYLASGCPLLAIIETDSELASFVSTEQLGIVPVAKDSASIAVAIRTLYHQRAENHVMRQRALEVATRSFTATAVMPAWQQLFQEQSG